MRGVVSSIRLKALGCRRARAGTSHLLSSVILCKIPGRRPWADAVHLAFGLTSDLDGSHERGSLSACPRVDDRSTGSSCSPTCRQRATRAGLAMRARTSRLRCAARSTQLRWSVPRVMASCSPDSVTTRGLGKAGCQSGSMNLQAASRSRTWAQRAGFRPATAGCRSGSVRASCLRLPVLRRRCSPRRRRCGRPPPDPGDRRLATSADAMWVVLEDQRGGTQSLGP